MNETGTAAIGRDGVGDALAIASAAQRLLAVHGWTSLSEVPLPDGRRVDLLALAPDGSLAVVEVKSCARDFLTDQKWPGYRDWCDRLYFAVDDRFPLALLPPDTGLIVAAELDAAILRQPPEHRLASPRRRALTLRFALLAARRLSGLPFDSTRSI